jgi:hypothetical protein
MPDDPEVVIVPDPRMPSRWFRMLYKGEAIGTCVFGSKEMGFVYTDTHTAARDLGWLGYPLPFFLKNRTEVYLTGVEERERTRMSCVESTARRLENERYLHSTPQIVRRVVERRMHDEIIWRCVQRGVASALAKEMRRTPKRKMLSPERRQVVEIEARNRMKAIMRRKARISFLWYKANGFPWPMDMAGVH